MAEIETAFKLLFIVYALSYDLARSLQTVGFSVTNFFVADPNGPILSQPKITKRVVKLYAKYRQSRV
jgi:hypothetical protein